MLFCERIEGISVIVEPTRLFDHNPDNPGDVSNQRPDIFIRNPRGASSQVMCNASTNDTS